MFLNPANQSGSVWFRSAVRTSLASPGMFDPIEIHTICRSDFASVNFPWKSHDFGTKCRPTSCSRRGFLYRERTLSQKTLTKLVRFALVPSARSNHKSTGEIDESAVFAFPRLTRYTRNNWTTRSEHICNEMRRARASIPVSSRQYTSVENYVLSENSIFNITHSQLCSLECW